VDLGNAANTVTIVPGSEINGNLNLGSNAGSKLALGGASTQAISQAVTGSIENSGSLVKQGAGTWIIDKPLSASAATAVLAGMLTVDQTLNSPFVTVLNGAVLKGTGTITGSVLNSGMISPGHSPGTLTIGGNFTQTSSGVLSIALASPTNFSRLVVGGHASLDGALLLRLTPGFVPQATNHFNVLTAGQGISGTFRSVTDPGGPPFSPRTRTVLSI
jgi:autotransporter-associated beta strand protein